MTPQECDEQLQWLGHAYAYDSQEKQSFIHFEFESEDWCAIGDDYTDSPPAHCEYSGDNLNDPIPVEYIRRLMDEIQPDGIENFGEIERVVVSPFRLPIFEDEVRNKIQSDYEAGKLTTGPFGTFSGVIVEKTNGN